jgi:hypothetical protein
MNTKDIPEGWWLNVTIMARFQDSFIVGVMRKGKASWITEHVIGNLSSSEEAYDKGMKFISNYKKIKKHDQKD